MPGLNRPKGGAAGGGEPDRREPAPALAWWRLALSVALVAALAATLLVAMLWSDGRPGSGRGTPPAPARTERGTAAAPSTSPTPSTALAGPAATTTTVGDDREALLAAARRALRAWGRFAATGDLAAVRPHFWPDGPQYQQFQREAPGLRTAPGPPYSYTLQAPTLHTLAGERVVRGTVMVSRPGERSKTMRWALYLRQDPAGRWRVWTVDAAPVGR